jgi:WD40 repeat protein
MPSLLSHLRQREEQLLGSARGFPKHVSQNLALVHRLEKQHELEGHQGAAWICIQHRGVRFGSPGIRHASRATGCVNTVSFSTNNPRVLVSGSDDCNVVLWDWQASTCVPPAPQHPASRCITNSTLLPNNWM